MADSKVEGKPEEEKTEKEKSEAKRKEEDERTVWVPKGYDDPMLEHPHFAQKGENVVSCRLDVKDPVKKIGKQVLCVGCGQMFDVKLDEEVVQPSQ